MLLNQIGQTDTMAPNGIQCPAISAERNLPQTISFCRGLTSFANFRFFGPLFCFSSIEGSPKGHLPRKLNRAGRYVLLAGSRAAGAPGCRSTGRRRDLAERTTPPLCAVYGLTEGHDPQAEIMIPTLMARHRVKRPAMSMEGGTKLFLRSGPPRRRLTLAFEKP